MATILIVIGIMTGLLGLLDIFLSKSQKDSLDGYVLRAWDWLSDARKFSLVGWLLQSGFRKWFFAGATVLVSTLAFEFASTYRGIDRDVAAIVLLIVVSAAATGGVLGWGILRHILARDPAFAPIRAIIFFVAVSLGWALVLFVSGLGGLYSVGIFAVMWALIAGAAVETFIMIAILPLLVVSLMQGALFVLEVVVRRIAESPKGVVMAVSGMATAIGSAIKALG